MVKYVLESLKHQEITTFETNLECTYPQTAQPQVMKVNSYDSHKDTFYLGTFVLTLLYVLLLSLS